MPLSLHDIVNGANAYLQFQVGQKTTAQAEEASRQAALKQMWEQNQREAQMKLQQDASALAREQFDYGKTQDAATILRQTQQDALKQRNDERDYMEKQRAPMVEATMAAQQAQADTRAQLQGDLSTLTGMRGGAPFDPGLFAQMTPDQLRAQRGLFAKDMPEVSFVGDKMTISPKSGAQVGQIEANTTTQGLNNTFLQATLIPRIAQVSANLAVTQDQAQLLVQKISLQTPDVAIAVAESLLLGEQGRAAELARKLLSGQFGKADADAAVNQYMIDHNGQKPPVSYNPYQIANITSEINTRAGNLELGRARLSAVIQHNQAVEKDADARIAAGSKPGATEQERYNAVYAAANRRAMSLWVAGKLDDAGLRQIIQAEAAAKGIVAQERYNQLWEGLSPMLEGATGGTSGGARHYGGVRLP
jgi:hypothetical protein